MVWNSAVWYSPFAQALWLWLSVSAFSLPEFTSNSCRPAPCRAQLRTSAGAFPEAPVFFTPSAALPQVRHLLPFFRSPLAPYDAARPPSAHLPAHHTPPAPQPSPLPAGLQKSPLRFLLLSLSPPLPRSAPGKPFRMTGAGRAWYTGSALRYAGGLCGPGMFIFSVRQDNT